MLLATPIGFLSAYAIRNMRGKAAGALFGFLLLPQVAPVILLAIGVFFLYIRLRLVDSFLGIVLAHTALAVPFVVTTVSAGLKRFDFSLDQAARSPRCFALQGDPGRHIAADPAFPLRRGDLRLRNIARRDRRQPVHRRRRQHRADAKMFLALRDQVDPTIAAISTLLIVVSVIAVGVFMIAVQRDNRRREGKI